MITQRVKFVRNLPRLVQSADPQEINKALRDLADALAGSVTVVPWPGDGIILARATPADLPFALGAVSAQIPGLFLTLARGGPWLITAQVLVDGPATLELSVNSAVQDVKPMLTGAGQLSGQWLVRADPGTRVGLAGLTGGVANILDPSTLSGIWQQ